MSTVRLIIAILAGGFVAWLLWRWSEIPDYLARKYAPCPACGFRFKDMKFRTDVRLTGERSNEQGFLVSRCLSCQAIWLARPEVEWKKWAVRIEGEIFEEAKPEAKSE